MKHIRIYILSVALLSSLLTLAGKDSYPVSAIPDSLLKNANNVVRLFDVDLEMKRGQAVYRFHRVVTVLNDNGASELSLWLYYNQFRKIESFDVVLYDKDGKRMNRRFDDAFRDYALYDGFSLYSDARAKSIQTGGGSYPVTVDYSYTIVYNGFVDVPDWYIQEPNQAVEEASLNITADENEIRYKCYNINLQPVITRLHNSQNSPSVYHWQVGGLKTFEVPVESYDGSYFLPHIDVTPLRFEIAGHSGSWDSWNTFGKAMYDMWKDKRDLSADAVEKVKAMVKGATTDRQRAQILYNYLQQNFRYVGVQIGVGGYIPFSAATVHITHYGDCKALSNYMCALLTAVGIKSCPAMINAGDNEHELDTAFVSNDFNHVIVYAELNDGPLWLECTSDAIPFGQLGTFTENRYALVFDENGGRLVKTPDGNDANNAIDVWNTVNVNESAGDIRTMGNIRGEYQLEAKSELIRGTDKDKASYLFSDLGFKQPDKYELHVSDSLAAVSFTLTGNTATCYDFKSGAKVFYPSTLMGSWCEKLVIDSTFSNDLVVGFPCHKTEHLSYNFSPATSITSLPVNYELENSVVTFKRKCERQPDGHVSVVTEFRLKKHIIPYSDIHLLREGFQAANKYLQQRVVIQGN